ncbi:MAG TPA: DNA-directed RNA polymerase subunit omega [Lachnospiraceae bacterium]
MIHPSYTELMEVVNKENVELDEAPLVTSRYSIVLATSKRARQLIAGQEAMVANTAGKKPLSVAVEEVYKNQVSILPEESKDEEEV